MTMTKKMVSKKIKRPKKSPLQRSLTWSQRLSLDFYSYLILRVVVFKSDLKDNLKALKKGLSKETKETKEMLEIYRKQTLGQATKREIKKANKQLRDLMKGMGIGVILILPLAPLTLPILVKLGDRIGINILPDSFERKK